MLKSTYKAPLGLPPLPGEWTQHTAPDRRLYYYNDSTKQSTYVRPTSTQHLQFGANISNNVFPPKSAEPPSNALNDSGFGQKDYYHGRSDGRTAQTYKQRSQPKDKPKRKVTVPGCPPWLLVHTKLGRRFVYDPESQKSFWKFPPDVLKAVIEFDRQEREERTRKERGLSVENEGKEQAATDVDVSAVGDQIPTISAAPAPAIPDLSHDAGDTINDEYEEVEVTDDEGDELPSKRQRIGEGGDEEPVEFNEDDIAYQLTAMGEDYGLDPGEYGDGEGEELEEGAEGLALTEEDSKALFKDLLSDYQVSPYIPWERIIDAGLIIEDDRYTVLPNMRSRKAVWDEWSRETIQQLKEQREKEEKKDPSIPYFAFLQAYASPKLYWPEFKRKYRKEPEMHNTKLSDKDREKWYREYISRLKLPEPTLKTDLVKFLKSIPLHLLNRSTMIDSLPPSLLTDIRYISLRNTIRDPLIEAHISTLSPAPIDIILEETDSHAKTERERRERALAERQSQVQEEKRRQRGALQQSKGMLREGEEELQKAMKVGKEGLLGHMSKDDSP